METARSLSHGEPSAADTAPPPKLPHAEPPEPADHEYSVVELRIEPTTLAFASLFLGVGWLRLFWWLWDGPFWIALAVALLIGLFGTACGWRGYRRHGSFASLCALLLAAGFLASLVLPAVGFFLVLGWPR